MHNIQKHTTTHSRSHHCDHLLVNSFYVGGSGVGGEVCRRPKSVGSRNAQTHFGIALERGHQLFLLGRLGLKHDTTTNLVSRFSPKKIVKTTLIIAG